ncbi:MAG: hypothetical protein KBA46_03825 [Candidatus Omnitrophica bacterium]|nr:hypothetical protein [Candidatus Omnitrophota bacterium]
MVIVLLMNALVALSAYWMTYRLLGFTRCIDGLLAFFIVYFGQIIIVETGLGIANSLFLNNVIIAHCVVLAIVWFLSRTKLPVTPCQNLRDSLSSLIRHKVVLLGFAFILGFGIVKIAINLVNPPCGWDNISYHFVFPVEWLKSGTLDTPISICDDPSPPYYPINGSLFFLWFMLPLKNVFLADLGQVPFFIVAFLSVYAICRKLDVRQEYAFFGAALFMLTPNVFKQLEIAYVDVMMAALFFAGLNFLLALRQDFSLKHCVAWSLYCGAFLGTKTSAIIYGLFLIGLFFVLLVGRIKEKQGVGRVFGYLAVFFAIIIITGGYTYVKNFLVTGNPLFPADIHVLGKRLFKGVMPFATYRAHWTPEDFNLKKFLFGEGMGGQFIIFVIPAVILAPLVALKRANRGMRCISFYVSLLPIALFLSFIFLMPQFWVRYLYPFLGMGFVGAMMLIELARVPAWLVRTLVFACFVASVGELSGHLELFSSMMFSLLFFFSLRKLMQARITRAWLIGLGIGLFALLHILNIDYDAHEYDRYAKPLPYVNYVPGDRLAWKWVNDNAHGVRIAYAGIPHMLPLYGRHFKNDVMYVSVNKVQPIKLHYFPEACYTWDTDYLKVIASLEREGNFREHPNYSTWLRNLHSEQIRYLVVYSFRRLKTMVFPLEDVWAGAHPEDFTLAYTNDAVHIYEVKSR